MPRSHKPRRRYVPKQVDPDPAGLAISGASLLSAEQRAALTVPMDIAFHAFRAGQGSDDAWCNLADALNVAEALAERRIANDHADKFQAAQAVLADVNGRAGRAGGSYTLYAREITALDDALFIHRIQLDHCTQTELFKSIETVKRRVRGALSGSASPGTRVCLPGALGRSSHQPERTTTA